MKMSAEYMQETVDWMVGQGFSADRREDSPASPAGAVLFERITWVLTRGDERLSLEALNYPDGREAWFMAIERFHGMRVNSYPLDSWKHRAQYVEFKFNQDAESGLGLSFFLDAVSQPSRS